MNQILTYTLYALATTLTIGAILVITQVGKERKPLTGAAAAISTLLSAIHVTALIAAAQQLQTLN